MYNADMTKEVEKLIREFAETVVLNKGRAFYVGGYVRDSILGVESKDIDIEVHGIGADALRKIVESHFKDFAEEGEAFGVLRALVDGVEIDISLPRTDSKVGEGHRGFDVHVDPGMGVEEASRRRDFTINSMLQDVLTGEVVDSFGGRRDLERRVLRVVDDKLFGDDPLRVLRGVQLAARFELEVEAGTLELMKSMVSQMNELSMDRRRDEWRKLFLKAVKPSVGLELARKLGVFDGLAIIDEMKSTEQDEGYHPEGDVWVHTLMVTDEAALICNEKSIEAHDRLHVMLGAFCHDLGKPESTYHDKETGRIRATGHSDTGIYDVDDVLEFFGLAKYRDAVKKYVEYHMHPMWMARDDKPQLRTDGAYRILSRKLKPATMRLLSFVTEADRRGRGPFEDDQIQRSKEVCEQFRVRAEELGVSDSTPPDVVRGNDLLAFDLKPGPLFSILVEAANILHDEDGMGRDEILKKIESNKKIGQVKDVEAALKLLR